MRFAVINTIVFIGLTAVGTIFHEMGHWLFARLMGCFANISYHATNWYCGNELASSYHEILILAGGPISTIFTGTFGFLLFVSALLVFVFIKLLSGK